MTTQPYHYVECGLDNVWLQNGFTLSPEGDLFISEVNELHNVIGHALIRQSGVLDPKEIRFIRRHLDFSQAGLGKILGVEGQTVQKWEKGNSTISESTDKLLKAFYCGFLAKGSDIYLFLEELSHLDAENEKQKLILSESEHKWSRAA